MQRAEGEGKRGKEDNKEGGKEGGREGGEVRWRWGTWMSIGALPAQHHALLTMLQ